MTSNSGGSWFNTTFQNLYLRAQFLGEFIEPKDLTSAAVSIRALQVRKKSPLAPVKGGAKDLSPKEPFLPYNNY